MAVKKVYHAIMITNYKPNDKNAHVEFPRTLT